MMKIGSGSGALVALSIVAALALGSTPAEAQSPATAQGPATSKRADFEHDRRSILAMAGDYRVRFDFRETVSFLPDYRPIAPKTSGGYESVRVIEDTGRVIVLQHLLVAEMEGRPHVIKHWRQDWVYEPTSVLTYAGKGRWSLRDVSAAERAGAWSQTVWQTDDSPRYGGVGRWRYEDGVASWESRTLRPLARRDAVRRPMYDRYAAMNRHALTPTGWVHEQDNAKLGGGRTYVHEVVLNTYDRFNGYPVKAADEYWSATKQYWARVRAAWAAAIARNRGVSVPEEAENGSTTGPELMTLAEDVAAGRVSTAEAAIKAWSLIDATTAVAPGRPPG